MTLKNTPPTHAADGQYRVPRDTSRWPSLALAAAMHAGLFFFLWVGVQWQSTEPVAVEAEVWDMSVQTAAPPPPPAPEVEPTPPAPAPKPAPEVEPPAPPPPKVAPVEPPDEPKQPDIALERQKARLKAEKEKHAEEVKRREQQKREEQLRQEKQDKLEKEKAEEKAEKAEKEKADKAAKLLKDKEKQKEKDKEKAKADAKAQADAEARADKDAADKKAAADKAAKVKREAAEKKSADVMHAAEMSRITGATGSGTSGTAAKSTAPRLDSGYVAAITAKIKSNIAYSGSTDVEGNPRAIFKIEQLPTGEIISVRKIKSSGIAGYDSAVENAIAKSSPLPKKKDGTVVREVEAIFDIKDKQ